MTQRSPLRRPMLAGLAVLSLALGGALAVPLSATAVPVPADGTELDVKVSAPGNPSVFAGGPVYVRVDAPTQLVAVTESAMVNSVDIELWDGSTKISWCTIPAHGTSCNLDPVQLAAGSQSLEIVVADHSDVNFYQIEFFGVTPVGSAQATPGLDWQDALGAWHDGTGVGTKMLADQVTAYRFRLTNNTNAPIHVTGYELNGVASSVSVDIAAGGTAYFPGGGPARAETFTDSVVAEWDFTDAVGHTNGNGTGGGVAVLPGSAALSTSTASPGETVTLTGAEFFVQEFNSFGVFFNSTPVALGNVSADQAGAFELSFPVPSGAAPGDHMVTLLLGDYAVAALPLAVPGLAATGVDPAPYTLLALLLLVAGGGVLALRFAANRRG